MTRIFINMVWPRVTPRTTHAAGGTVIASGNIIKEWWR